MEIKKIISVLGDDKGSVVSAREIGKSGGSAVLIEKSILSNGLYYAADDDADGYGKVAVSVGGGADLSALEIYIADFVADPPTVTDGALDGWRRCVVS